MSGWEEAYRSNTPTSRKMFERSRQLHVNGISHNIRYFEPYPFVTRHSEGKSLVDVDSNTYTDYWMGHWSLILGHGAGSVTKELESQIGRGWMYGTLNEQTIRLSELIAGAVPAAERIRYVASGTEAVMYATRLARAFTGRPIIAKVDGGWHGYASDLLKTVNWPFTQQESAGTTSDEYIVSIPYNDIERSRAILESVKDRLAAILVEPVLGGGGCIPAERGYLRSLQEFAAESGALLILDEIVTGFRFRYGCMYEDAGLDPDIITLGKIVGGGMSTGVICGKEEIMEIANTSKMSRSARCYIGGGTFSANPASMVAGAATLDALKSEPGIYQRINRLGQDTRNTLSKIFDGRVRVTGMGSLFMTHFAGDDATNVTDAAAAAGCDQTALRKYHMYLMAKEGIFILPGKLGAFSSAHRGEDADHMAHATERFVAGEY